MFRRSLIGGKSAAILYANNGCCTSVGTSMSASPVSRLRDAGYHEIGNGGNTVTIPIAATGRTCTPSNPGISSDLDESYGKVLTLWAVFLTRATTTTTPATAVFRPPPRLQADIGLAGFRVSSASQLLSLPVRKRQLRACVVTSYTGQTLPAVTPRSQPWMRVLQLA
jgi:hypothetical protein